MSHCLDHIYNDLTSPMTEHYLQLSKKESAKERRWHWVRSVEEDREIMAAIDAEQSTTEEKMVFLAWLGTQNAGNIGPSFKWGLSNALESPERTCGRKSDEEDFLNWYTSILEEMEVVHIGDKWAEGVEQLHLTLYYPFGSGLGDVRLSRNWTMALPCRIVKKGSNYWTAVAEKELGKIYIPKNIIPKHLQSPYAAWGPLSVEVIFTGFPACRGKNLPWRAVHIEKIKTQKTK